ncbi:DUF3343 domain-containing protein [Clostridium sp. cel8]|uniref:DUF3343 domain-containing protein n=2 Tax=unclassified Clostridium TaxID=2614128 RepID=UPI0015F3A201|nr:DUF3343 domain-containing protein [Clostridium sp. cel8]MBA5852015.1 DUF3343 domain-containing protein [Clostridium sp. cel8]
MDKYYIITFKNTNEAIAAEQFLDKKRINIDIVPTPVFITQSCGISVRVDVKNFQKIKELVNNKEFKFKNIYERQKQGYSLID